MSENEKWATCPKCQEKLQAEQESLYGKVSEEEYIAFLDKKKEAEMAQTLCEDYGIGVYGNEFEVSYGCFCTACDFKYTYRYKTNLMK